jgi:hypothetical protein
VTSGRSASQAAALAAPGVLVRALWWRKERWEPRFEMRRRRLVLAAEAFGGM